MVLRKKQQAVSLVTLSRTCDIQVFYDSGVIYIYMSGVPCNNKLIVYDAVNRT